MKIYYDHNEDDSWTEITSIKQYPFIPHRLDETSQINFVIRDFEGALYSTWSGYNFIPIKVEDDSSNVLFRGYLTGKKFSYNKLYCVAHGLSVKLDWVPLHKNYILEEGLVKNVPSDEALPLVENLTPNTDAGGVNWQKDAGEATHWETVDTIDAVAIYATDGDENATETFGLTTTVDTVTEATSVTVYTYGKYGGTDRTITVDFYNGVGWEGAVAIDMTDSYAWYETTFAGLSMSQANVDAAQIKYTANGTYIITDFHWIDKCYVEITFTGTASASLDLTDNDGDAFTTWAADQWHQNIDTAIIIRDTSDNWSSKPYTASAVAAADHTDTNGNAASCQTKNDADYFEIVDQGADPNHLDATGTITLSGDNIDSTTQNLKEILITWNIGVRRQGNVIDSMKEAIIEIRYNETTWKTLFKTSSIAGESVVRWFAGTYTIKGSNTELAKYLSKTGVNYDSIENIRVRLNSYGDYPGANDNEIQVDYLKADVYYYEQDIAPITETITDNGLSWVLTSGVVWGETGISGESAPGAEDGDSFVIGVSTTTVLEEAFGFAGVALSINSTLTKYIAQHYKGTYCKEILNKIKLLEGIHWFEDHANNQVIIAKEANFVDSTEDLTDADYDFDWEFEDDNNYYGAVEVFGSAGYGIYYKAVSETSDSPRTKTIIEETIMTIAEAKDVADSVLSEMESKRPSIKIILPTVYNNLQIGRTVGLTLTRPTVNADDYPIRMIERSKFGGAIKTVIYCGLGHSTEAEKIAKLISESLLLAHKAHTDRLISTPYAPGATVTWGDVGGAQTAVEAIITTEVGAGESIDNAIDSLIATHASDVDAHHKPWIWRDDEVAAWDFDEDNNDFSTIGDVVNTWYDLDLSSIVDAGATLCFCEVNAKDGAAGSQVRFRKNGDTQAHQYVGLDTQVANQGQRYHFIIGLDGSYKIEFNGFNVKPSDWTKLELKVLAWQ